MVVNLMPFKNKIVHRLNCSFFIAYRYFFIYTSQKIDVSETHSENIKI